MSSANQKALQDGAKAIALAMGDIVIDVLRVEPGSFTIGSPPGEAGRRDNEGPLRLITLTKAFYLGKHPVTQRQYTTITGKPPVKPAGPDVAIDQLTYADALEFCKAASNASGVTVTLPTEAQWEYACRADTKTRFWSGDGEEDLAKVGWYRENSAHRAREVGSKPANPWGFHDMHGNVCEFCRDELLDYGKMSDKDPVGRTSRTEGMMRGGGWMYPADYCRSASRVLSNDRFGGAGLRICIET